MSKPGNGPGPLRNRLPLPGVLLLALALRVWGLTWGLPSATHYFSYHPDESLVLVKAMGMNVFDGRLLPHFYNYGSLQLYLVLLANTLAFVFGGVNIVLHNWAADWGQWARMYLIGRWLTVLMGVGTVWATAALGTRLWGRRAGLSAALVLAVMPLHAQHGHWLTVDVPATLWVVLSLLWTVRLASEDPRSVRAALAAGLFAGLAAATKYNMALAILPLILAGVLTRRVKPAAVGLIACGLAFLGGCPGAALEPATFARGLAFEAVHVRNADDPTFKDTGSGFVYHIAQNLDAGLGLPLLLLALAGVGYALVRRERGDGLLAAFALPYYVLIGLAAVRYARYVIPLLPVLALWTGRLLAAMAQAPRPAWRAAGAAAGLLVLGLTLADTLALIRPMAGVDSRDRALREIERMPTATVGFAVEPWFGAPPVSPYFSLPARGAWRAATPPETARRIVFDADWSVQTLESGRPELVALSEYDYDDALRLHDPAAASYLQALQRNYTRIGVFGGATLFSRVRTIDGLPAHDLPHDMLYPNPIISLYQRKTL